MMDGMTIFEALGRRDLDAFLTALGYAARSPASRHALRIDATRYAALQVNPEDDGSSCLALIGFAAGVLLSDRLSGPLAPFARPSAALLASAQALWCLRGSRPYRPDLPELLLLGDLPQDTYALSHALSALVQDNDVLHASEVIDRLLDRGLEREQLVALLARVVTAGATDYRPLHLLSGALQLSARLGGDEVGNLFRAVVRGTLAVRQKPPLGTLPARTPLPPELEDELPQLLAAQVNPAGVTDLRRVRAAVRAGGPEGAWQALLHALRNRTSWQALVDMLSLVAAERLLTATPSRLEEHAGLHQILEAMAQVHAVRWLMHTYPSAGSIKALLQLAAYVGWISFACKASEPVERIAEQSATRLLSGLRDALKRADRLAASSLVARYRELNLPREALAGVLAEEGARGAQSVEGTALRLLVTENALAEAGALYGSMEEGAYFQGLARVLTMIPPEDSLLQALESRPHHQVYPHV